MRFSRLFVPTIKETPADAEVVSHRLMVRAGMIRKVAAGIYNILPMGLRTIRKVEQIVREEMTRAGAEEILMPFVQPSELWEQSGRWDQYGKELLRLKDRNGREFCLGPTHEEVITTMVSQDVRSYKELPKNLFQIQSKFRDEIRPRFGLMRGREFIMKDAYSFHEDDASAKEEYDKMHSAYCRIFERCGLEFRAVEADSGQIGGSFSHEFMVMADTGEDGVATCGSCDYGANIEKAELALPLECAEVPASSYEDLKEVSTPNKKSIEEVSEFLKVSPEKFIKTLIFDAVGGVDGDGGDGIIVALVRGDYDINEIKLKNALGVESLELASDEAVDIVTGTEPGYAGPVGLDADGVKTIIADLSVREMINAVTGANKKDTHLLNVNPGRDFTVKYADLRTVVDGDSCPRCGNSDKKGKLTISRGIEVGHIFKLGTKYSEAMGAMFLDKNGKEKPMVMCCYGIGIGRTAASAIEQNNDDYGIKWPIPLAPFTVEVVTVNTKDEATVKASEALYEELLCEGIEVLIDDRDERAGFKFKDAELIGFPLRVAVSPKTLEEDSVELFVRSSGEKTMVKRADIVSKLKELLKA